MGETLQDTGIANDFLNRTPITQEIKSKNLQMTLQQIKNFCIERIQNGNWDTDTDCMSSRNQGPC
jgi:hypothetical protein